MRAAMLITLAVIVSGLTLSAKPTAAAWPDRYEVFGVDENDMLKMRAGPGIGYVVIVGLPNGTVVRVQNCEQSGSTRWCRVSLDRARGLKGYVSAAYLRKL